MTNASQASSGQSHSGQKDTGTLADRARHLAGDAQEKVSAATTATVDAAKEHPYATAGIVAGVAAAIGGAAYAASRRNQTDSPKGKTTH